MEDLRRLIRRDEKYDTIQIGKCKICNEPYAVIVGSSKTCRRDGRRFAQINSDKIGWCAFRCDKCNSVIDETWVPNENIKAT